jgi:ribosomal protein L16 Arg81 hydroxylase
VRNFAQLIAPHTVPYFVENHLGKEHLLLRGFPGRFESLFSWGALNGILAEHELTSYRLQLVKDDAGIPYSEFTSPQPSGSGAIADHRLAAHFADGATIRVIGVDEFHAPVASFASDLERTLSARISANAYAACGTIGGFGLHYDDHDTLILQVSGRKHWRMYGYTKRYPVSRFSISDRPGRKPEADFIMEEGDALYVPRGIWHAVVACGEPTLHLTVGIVSATGVNLTSWLAERLKAVDTMRMDVPLLAGAAIRKRYAEAVRDAFNAVLEDPQMLDEFASAWNGAAMPRPTFGLPFHAPVARGLGEEPARIVVSMRAPRQLTWTEALDGEAVELTVCGKTFTFHAAVVPVLEFLRDNCPVTLAGLYSELQGHLPKGDIEGLLSDLISNGVIAAVLTQPPGEAKAHAG